MSPALEHLAGRASTDPKFFGYLVASYQTRKNLTDEQLAAALGCPVERLTNIRLCGLPRTWNFTADCRSIAEKFGVKVEVIEQIAWPW